MKCPYCDYENKPTSRFCENCGAQLISDEGKEEQVHENGGAAPEPSSYAEDVFSGTAEDAGHDGFNQYGGQESPYQQADMPQGYGMPPVTPKKKNSKLGIAVLILGFLGMGSRFFGLIAIGLGVYDLVKNKDKKHVLVIIGIVLAAIGIVFGSSSNHRTRNTPDMNTESAAPAPTKAATATPAPTKAPTATATAAPTEAPAADTSKAEPSAESSVPEATNQQNQAEAASSFSSYDEIYETYAQKLREATPGLIEEYEAEAAENTGGVEGLAEIANQKVEELAEITTEGTGEMASFMMTNGLGNYEEYEEWAEELYDVYEDEAEKITNAYLDSASSAVIDDLDLGDLDLGDFDIDF